ncbi:hypothetical protein OHU11_05025 [Streptomyces sp. NBC_00257]|uniref:hypothetical protein n=1 Tax=unclassified Streptomyces TaxID=2593676 RepID=UPI002257751B|nr:MULTISPECIES: hypothetical protein [unclassified Streptomyces]WTB58865.1 hypothetical protein OG832_39825 [Streptomyces sp. NBC_00826]WTH88258.1 hypothetical protein OIC43_03885 [Streptomyces sp. NBC_00825]WTH96986.1 hypothetical protein OHA23_03885 [Streptomyces sp. NBC_00822]MCX4862474.1 hypothetical protein [Streptomyces sp. NBC_00906]MCX4893711.1 hypothetical protein [Streptomyces sp. NBC_00892]
MVEDVEEQVVGGQGADDTPVLVQDGQAAHAGSAKRLVGGLDVVGGLAEILVGRPFSRAGDTPELSGHRRYVQRSMLA